MSPTFHAPLCYDIDHGADRRLDLWPRGHLKTHIITIGKSIQRYLQNREIRILLASAKQDSSNKNLSKIKSLWEANKVLRWLFPECRPNPKRDRWTEMEATLPRTKLQPEPTFKAIGVGGSVAGWHFDAIVKDDLIDEQTEQSPLILEKIYDWHILSHSLRETLADGVDHIVGTRWIVGDIYQMVEEQEKEYQVRKISAIKKDGTPAWPERFSLEHFLEMRRKDPYRFACQYMNDPRDPSITSFNANWLKYFEFANEGMDLLVDA